jgi:hypothetical protein
MTPRNSFDFCYKNSDDFNNDTGKYCSCSICSNLAEDEEEYGDEEGLIELNFELMAN